MKEEWRLSVAPMSIDFIRAWRWEMCDTRIVGSYRLVDRHGLTRDQQRAQEVRKSLRTKEEDHLAWKVRQLFGRGKTLKLAGTDLIRLAQCEADAEVVKIVTELVYAGETEFDFNVTRNDVQDLELYREIEFDEFAGHEFLESHADFDQVQSIWAGREPNGRILRSVS